MANELKDEIGLGLSDIAPIQLVKDTNGSDVLPAQAALNLTTSLKELVQKFKGGVSLGGGLAGYKAGNLDAGYADFLAPSVANTEFAVLHRLGRKPIGFLIVFKDASADVYASSFGSWTNRLMFLKCTVASVTMKMLVW